ncbi:hypothetical protein Taro_029596 [Colocasia esculenta]|uniref:Uncharacterized protein n=1 Tax=Colocasia esculenta TaxID=4460 RepID=A0A843VE73_COLES|nr:hypothetical protein [Colocasia esculenta]
MAAKSFAQTVLGPLMPQVLPMSIHPPARTDMGEPVVFFSSNEIKISYSHLELAIIAPTPLGSTESSSTNFAISALDNRHLHCSFTCAGEEYELRKDLKVRDFRTHHAIPSQGNLIYSARHKLKQEYAGLKGDGIKNLKSSGVEVSFPNSAL